MRILAPAARGSNRGLLPEHPEIDAGVGDPATATA
jgi:hypothetical protein